VISIDLKERRFFFLAFFNREIASRMELTPHRQIHGVRDLTRYGIESVLLFRQLGDGTQ
jgi:hypothetical protein